MLFEMPISQYLSGRTGADAGRRTRVMVPRMQVVSGPAEEPVTLAEMKTFLKVDGNDDDSGISGQITLARQVCEAFTGRAFITRTLKAWYDAAPSDIVLALPYAPATSISSVTYYGDDDAEQTLASTAYQADVYGEPARIILKRGSVWPTSLRNANALAVQYVCGYGAAASVPSGIKEAIKSLVVHFYEGRDSQQMDDQNTALAGLPNGVKAALAPFVVPRFDD